MFLTEKDRALKFWALLTVLAILLLQSCRNRDHKEVSLPPARSTERAGAVLSYADVVDGVAPAVVTIRSQRVVRAPRQFPFFNDPFFRDFFGDRWGAPADSTRPRLGRDHHEGRIHSDQPSRDRRRRRDQSRADEQSRLRREGHRR